MLSSSQFHPADLSKFACCYTNRLLATLSSSSTDRAMSNLAQSRIEVCSDAAQSVFIHVIFHYTVSTVTWIIVVSLFR